MSAFFITFDQAGTFAASDAAKAFACAAGFSIGSSQRGAPTALMFGDYAVSKWKNLNAEERRGTHAVLEGDNREGPVRLRLLPACPDAAVKALELMRAKSCPTPANTAMLQPGFEEEL